MAQQQNDNNNNTKPTQNNANESDAITPANSYMSKDFRTRHTYGMMNGYVETDWSGSPQITKQEVFSRDGVRLDERGYPADMDTLDRLRLKMKQEQKDPKIQTAYERSQNVGGAFGNLNFAFRYMQQVNLGEHLKRLKHDKEYKEADLQDFKRGPQSETHSLIRRLQTYKPIAQDILKTLRYYEKLEQKTK